MASGSPGVLPARIDPTGVRRRRPGQHGDGTARIARRVGAGARRQRPGAALPDVEGSRRRRRACVARPHQARHPHERATGVLRGPPPPGVDTTMLLPIQFRALVDVGRRPGELKQVAMAFIRLSTAPTTCSPPRASTAVLACSARSPSSSIATSAELDVCWLETQAEANSVRWTLIVRGTDGDRARRRTAVARAAHDRRRVTPPTADRRQPRRRVRRRHGPSRALHLHRHGRRDQPRRPPDGPGRPGRDHRRRATGRRVSPAGSRRSTSSRSWSRASAAGAAPARIGAPADATVGHIDAAVRRIRRWSGATTSWRCCCDVIAAGSDGRARRRGGRRQDPALARGAQPHPERRVARDARRATRGRSRVPAVPAPHPTAARHRRRLPTDREAGSAARRRSSQQRCPQLAAGCR